MPVNHAARLITLGRLRLVRPDGSEDEALTRRRRKLAVLAVLALSDRPVSRESLLEMFWGDQPEPLARHSLSDALSHLRHSLGRDAITMHRADVALAEEAPLRVDAVELAAAAASGDDERVVELYGGEFLAGLPLGGSARFEHWADTQRARALQLFARACARRCAVLLRAGRDEECAALAARWLDEVPLSGDAGQALLRALAAPGTAAALASACRAHEALTVRLVREFAAQPDPALAALARELGARLDRLVAAPPPAPAGPPGGVAPLAARPEPREVGTARAIVVAVPAPAVDESRPPRTRARRHASFAALIVGAAVVLASSVALVRRPPGLAHAGDVTRSGAIAVMPFRVHGADSSLAYLREGMIDLLFVELDGTMGPRAVDPRAIVSAWRRSGGTEAADLSPEAALEIARRLGATRLLVGGVVGTASRLVLTASVASVPSGRVLTRIEVHGPADSLTALVDRLVAGVLASEAGESGQRLAALTSASLPALRAYLAGREAYRSARMPDAVAQYRRALELDSSLALASLGLAAAGAWTTSAESERAQRELSRAWRLHTRLGERDRLLFDAYVGPRFPGVRTAAYELAAWERAAQVARDSPEAWYELGDRLFHVGAVLGIGDYERHAAAAFSRSVELDSSFALPIAHLLELSARHGDVPEVRRLLALYDACGAGGGAADFVHWRAATVLGDSAALRALRSRVGRVASASLERIVGTSQLEGVDIGTATLAAQEIVDRAATKQAKLLAYVALHDLALNRGGRAGSLAALERLREIEPLPAGFVYSVLRADHLAVADALFGGGDSAAALSVARALAARLGDARTPPEGAVARAASVLDLCTLGLWEGLRGEPAGLDTALARLHGAAPPADSAYYFGGSPALCLPILAAIREEGAHSPSAPAALRALDSAITTWPPVFGAEFANLVAARLWAARGDTLRALAAVRRRPYYWTQGPRYLATFLDLEARLAAAAGDRAGAARAARHLAALRSADPPNGADGGARR